MPKFMTLASADANRTLSERRWVCGIDAAFQKRLSARAERQAARLRTMQEVYDLIWAQADADAEKAEADAREAEEAETFVYERDYDVEDM